LKGLFYRSHRLARQVDSHCLRYDPIADGVGEGWIADDVEPFRHGDLGGNNCGGTVVAVLDDLQEREPGLGVEGEESEIIEDEDGGASDSGYLARVAAFGPLDLKERE